jgi:hypothetical protein
MVVCTRLHCTSLNIEQNNARLFSRSFTQQAGEFCLVPDPKHGDAGSIGVRQGNKQSERNILFHYQGDLFNYRQFSLLNSHQKRYVVYINDTTYLNGSSPLLTSWAHFINKPNRGERCNCVLRYTCCPRCGYRVFVYRLGTIRANSRLILKYQD